MCRSFVNALTSLMESLRPLPFALSGCVITSSGLNGLEASCSKMFLAKPGLPAKIVVSFGWGWMTMRDPLSDLLFQQFFPDPRSLEIRNVVNKDLSL